ncbi:heavy-metal-associated domain-containing protein [Chitinophaga sp. sic0106]|uniref:heavy-metal-associated domain-containing protein n=1 Tax=Chitinophaga sp. sic0106 TaxID=2854785 RepID=UPI001C47DD07|nr:cation transporter [Chitinophaga sp. sic0106]MBV7529932.1 cation transporter [Chitinophaga sp. sic0106]
METYKFKTNINCSGCVAAVTPHLNKTENISHWEVDTTDPAKVLTVKADDTDAATIVEIVKKAGFTAEKI